jgi:hypothetical protein
MTGNDDEARPQDGRGGLQAGEAEDHDTPPGTAHVYIEAAPGLCFCSRPRFSGWHVGRDCGHVDFDRAEVRRELAALKADLGARLDTIALQVTGGWSG